MSASSRKKVFLETLDREYATTVRVLRALPADKSDFAPTPKNKSARELAWTFVLERGLSIKVWGDAFAKGAPTGGKREAAPQTMSEIITALEKAQREYRALLESASDEDFNAIVHFFTAPKTLGEISRHDFVWQMLHDEIHHRGQFSVYVRAAGGKLPSIYGPTADEPWT